VDHPRERFLEALHEPTEARQALSSRRHPGKIDEPLPDPIRAHWQWLTGGVARWKEPSPASHHLLVRPARGDLRIKPRQDVQVVVEYREPRHRNREDLGKFLEPNLDPSFTVRRPLTEQESSSHAPIYAVIPAGHRRIDKVDAGHRHWWFSREVRQNLSSAGPAVNNKVPVLSFLRR